ncbi:LamG domain-containing protein [Halorussus sp. MSC15.2]|uniref:LamG domain-containing protein n=1 Tax=Halorussus sp. MSC15.2 TaxID=2283638 RepID=UPI0013D26FFE|nr:LamG domain-containing protein [Halorussus sp. MSC15.2]NEU58600.1 LamG domain-containing protein [Halorussus sp. MSC15.2]
MTRKRRHEREDAERRGAQSRLRSVADHFHGRTGTLFDRATAVADVAAAIGVEEAQASEYVGRVAGDRVDPVVAVPTETGTFVGVLDYHEGDGWYGYTDYHDLRGPHRRGVCARCVREAVGDAEPYAVTIDVDRPWEDLGRDLETHFRTAHPSVETGSVPVETGAVLRSRTTVGGNRVWHTGNDGTGSGFEAVAVDGLDGATLNRRHTSDVGRHLDRNRLGLKLWYRFDLGTGGSVSDFSQHGATGNRKGTTWTSGRTGSALSFDGSDDRVAVNDNLVYNQSGELDNFTVMCWMKTTSSAEMSLVAWDRSEYYRFGMDSGGPALKLTNEGDWTYDHTPGGSINDGSWHHVAARYDHETGDSTLYVDGSQFAQTSAFGDGTSIGTGATRYGMVGVGSEASSPDSDRNSNYFSGTIDEVRVYHRALSGNEIQDIYRGVA